MRIIILFININAKKIVRDLILLAIAHIFIAMIFIADAINCFQSKSWRRLYWIISCGVTMVGIGGATWVSAFPPDRLDQQGRLIGEMPIEFGGYVMVVFIGMLLSLIGLIVVACQHWRQKIMGPIDR
ncbi:hypothetical protein [Burkholderia ubonensis]|uniref:hypothetical protein n=3 Tax=Burkholderia ubonensis TaxID=101571 RepID=UPI0012FAAA91|nr:hypothetical protein [Burkholderia ubonensis]